MPGWHLNTSCTIIALSIILALAALWGRQASGQKLQLWAVPTLSPMSVATPPQPPDFRPAPGGRARRQPLPRAALQHAKPRHHTQLPLREQVVGRIWQAPGSPRWGPVAGGILVGATALGVLWRCFVAAPVAALAATSGRKEQRLPAERLDTQMDRPLSPLIDIGVNLTDGQYQGNYRGKQCHEPDLEEVLRRAALAGVDRLLITGGTLEESRQALALAHSSSSLYSTVGVHPTRSNEFERGTTPERHIQDLLDVIRAGEGKVVAVGECGLDYDRLQFCDRDTQLRYFELQFQLAEASGLPMFLHNRNTGGDFARVMSQNRHRFRGGVAHSFTGDADELQQLLDLGLYIGINGCSLKTEENLRVMAQIPVDRLLLETDGPWCDIRPSHASHKYLVTKVESRKKEKFEMGLQVKSRNEPCNLHQVLEVVANYRSDVDSTAELSEIVYRNTRALFWDTPGR
mmetsp:Transcript_1291/g.2633  ORF Transcript_1291/g.2633 Transcript_1291/m.2633 type:complete len:459 (-) Transcript_1291:441-1817(-)